MPELPRVEGNVWDYLISRLTDIDGPNDEDAIVTDAEIDHLVDDVIGQKQKEILEEMPVMSNCGRGCVMVIERLMALLEACPDETSRPRKGMMDVVGFAVGQCVVFIRG